MYDDLANIQYEPIRDHQYARWFEEVHYNGKTLSESERREFISVVDEYVSQYSEGLPIAADILENYKDFHDTYHETERTVVSVILFVDVTMIDSMVAGKYFILADKDYDRRFMRGKLFVILNEGFKRLYGFNEKSHRKSEWDRLLPLMKYFPEKINRQYQELTYLLERHSRTSSWWRDERNLETHLDAEGLYKSRQEEIIESKVMMDSMKLFGALMAVDNFLLNMHGCLNNFLIGKFYRGEVTE